MGIKVLDLARVVNAATAFDTAGFERAVCAFPPEVEMAAAGERLRDFIDARSAEELGVYAFAIAKLISAARAIVQADVQLLSAVETSDLTHARSSEDDEEHSHG